MFVFGLYENSVKPTHFAKLGRLVGPALVYSIETVPLMKRQKEETEVAELKMLRISLGVARLD